MKDDAGRRIYPGGHRPVLWGGCSFGGAAAAETGLGSSGVAALLGVALALGLTLRRRGV
jgi:hypothetical protein